MRKNHRRSLFIMALAYLFLGTSVSTPQLFAAASGNYTDLLPIGAAGDTTVISRGSGWAVTTLPPTQTFGDSLSRLVDTVYQSTNPVTLTGSTSVSTFTALSGIGSVGSTTFPTSWIAAGRTIEVLMDGYYSTTASGGTNWTWAVKLGTTTIVTTGAVAATPGQLRSPFEARAVMTIAGVGAAGTVNGFYSILSSSGTSATALTPLVYSTYTMTAVPCDLSTTATSQNSINSTLLFSVATASITVNNMLIRFLN